MEQAAMKKFLAIYTGTKEARQRYEQNMPDPRQREAHQKKGIEAWQQWVIRHQQSIIEGGSPLGKTKRVAANGISDISNSLVGWTVVQAESYEAAARMFLNHPHFAIFPGDSVEVMECLPLPGG
jgi:hypothetical protein